VIAQAFDFAKQSTSNSGVEHLAVLIPLDVSPGNLKMENRSMRDFRQR
jgi:hypothetical protein